jgi:Arc/MetJ-type ribon-helix-helix transcriptional regulator
MSTQIAVRLPDDVVAFIDGLVADGEAKSRAQVVSRALERERRRRRALQDVEILKAQPDDGLGRVAEHVARLPRPDLD